MMINIFKMEKWLRLQTKIFTLTKIRSIALTWNYLKKNSTITSSSMMCWSFVFVVLVKNIVLIVSIICHLTSIFFKYFYLSMLASAVDWYILCLFFYNLPAYLDYSCSDFLFIVHLFVKKNVVVCFVNVFREGSLNALIPYWDIFHEHVCI